MLNPDIDWASPFKVDRLLEIRASGMKKMPGIDTMSGIDKQILPSPVKVSKLGIEGDEHDLTFHGGPDKAILGCKSGDAFNLVTENGLANTHSQTALPITQTGARATPTAPKGSSPAALAKTLSRST